MRIVNSMDSNTPSNILAPVKGQLFVRRQAHPGWVAIDFPELWRYRQLLLFHALRDIKVRYKQTALWGGLGDFAACSHDDGRQHRLWKTRRRPFRRRPVSDTRICRALFPWQLFAYASTQSSNSLVDNAHVLTKVYFPRLVIRYQVVSSYLTANSSTSAEGELVDERNHFTQQPQRNHQGITFYF